MRITGPSLGALLLSALPCCVLADAPSEPSGDSTRLQALQVLRDCTQAQAVAVSGVDGLRAACPMLERALLDLRLTDQLGPDWRDQINVETLADLVWLTERYQGEPDSLMPQRTALNAIMQSMRVSPAPTTWWQRFKTWLRSLLQQPPQQRSSWLSQLHWQWKPSQWVVRLIDYGLIASVLLLAAWVVWREARAVRALPSAPRQASLSEGAAIPAGRGEDNAELPDLQLLPPAQRASAVLVALIVLLRRSGRLQRERALTHRQLAASARFDDAAQRAQFERAALLAERCLYGRPEPLNTERLADAVALHAQLAAGMEART